MANMVFVGAVASAWLVGVVGLGVAALRARRHDRRHVRLLATYQDLAGDERG